MSATHPRRWTPPAASALAAALLMGCTSESAVFAPLGNCDATGDARCMTAIPVSGSPSPLPDGAANGMDAGPTNATDGGSCGSIDTFLATTAIGVHPGCVACIAASPCCAGDAICSNTDPACFATVACVSGNGCQDANCVNMCESQNPAGATDYLDLATCVTANCPTQCPFLSPVGDP